MFKVRERSGLLSSVLHLTLPLRTTDCKAYHPGINQNANGICWRKNRTANNSKAELRLSHPLTNRKPWWRFRKHGDSLLTKVIRKRCWESYKNKESQEKDAQKQSQGHHLIPQKVSFPLFRFPWKGFLTYLTTGEFRGRERSKNSV